MEISGLVQNETLFTLDLRHPATDKPTGIIVKVRSAASDAAMAVMRKQTDELIARQQRGKLMTADDVEAQELDKAVSYVASWEWGEHTFEGVTPDSDPATVRKIMEAQSWIYSQIVGAARSIANFTKASAKK